MAVPITPTYEFLSTLSLRRATAGKGPAVKGYRNFYPRSPCGERQIVSSALLAIHTISIHALLAESDRWNSTERPLESHFYPRSPCGERRQKDINGRADYIISIHALLAESDLNLPSRPIDKNISIHALLAESDLNLPSRPIDKNISIHALLAESDLAS